MKRRKFIALLGVAVMAWPLVAHAQEPKKIPHLCFLTFDPGTLQSSPRFGVFFNSLRDLGYVDGQTIVIHYLSADGKDDRFPALASECLRLKADRAPESTVLTVDGLQLDLRTRRADVDGATVELSAREFAVLLALVEASPRVLSRQQIEARLYNWDLSLIHI